MVANVLLDNVTHKNLMIHTSHGEEYGDAIRYSLVVPREIRMLSTCYPIVFRKDSNTGQFELVALFGFEPNENLFLNASGWDAPHIPLSVQRLPFAVGKTEDAMTGEESAVIHVDMDHPKVNTQHGERVFLEHGGNSPYLEKINSILAELISGVEESSELTQLLLKEELIVPFTLSIPIANKAIELAGFYTVDEEKLALLRGERLERIHANGVLGLSYFILASMSNIADLVRKKQTKTFGG